MVQTKTSHLVKVSYAIILLGWQYINMPKAWELEKTILGLKNNRQWKWYRFHPDNFCVTCEVFVMQCLVVLQWTTSFINYVAMTHCPRECHITLWYLSSTCSVYKFYACTLIMPFVAMSRPCHLQYRFLLLRQVMEIIGLVFVDHVFGSTVVQYFFIQDQIQKDSVDILNSYNMECNNFECKLHYR